MYIIMPNLEINMLWWYIGQMAVECAIHTLLHCPVIEDVLCDYIVDVGW